MLPDGGTTILDPTSILVVLVERVNLFSMKVELWQLVLFSITSVLAVDAPSLKFGKVSI